MLLLDGVDAPPTTELVDAPGTAAAIAGAAPGAARALATVPLIIVDIPAPAIAGIPDGMGVAEFNPPVFSSTFVCICAVGSFADDRGDSAVGVLSVPLAVFFLVDFWPDPEADEGVTASFALDKAESPGRTGLRSECRDGEGESETGCTPPSCA